MSANGLERDEPREFECYACGCLWPTEDRAWECEDGDNAQEEEDQDA